MMIFSTYTRSKTIPVWTSDIFVIKRTAMQLLAEFIGSQKIRLVGVGVSRLRERDQRQTLITDFSNCNDKRGTDWQTRYRLAHISSTQKLDKNSVLIHWS
jgi:hypothetical protein